ncbi:MAG: isoleucine--tRNA ligase [Candidatus Falkowbacteria bacterium]
MAENNQQNSVSFPQMESEVLAFWEKNQTFIKSLEKEAPHGDYVFYDGPPFATGTPHYGHIVGQIMKDVVPRYFTMNGYHVARRWGWDCHGLPIENIVEKELGMKTKKDIEDLGIEKFNALCRSKVSTYADEWYKVAAQLGRWVDTSNPYRTMDLNFMESVWWVFKQLWDKDLIYKNYRSMHVCPRCETTLSQSEVAEGYRDIKDLSATAKFELIDEPGTFVLAWTTTPWTLIGNVALAVGPEIQYVKVKSGEDILILAKERLLETFKEQPLEVLTEFPGAELVGKAYRPLFDYYVNDAKIENRENGWKIYGADFVTTTDGVGVVHIAPAFGEDDMNLGKANNLPFIQHVGMDGAIKAEAIDFAGLNVKPAGDHMTTDIEVIRYLAGRGLLFKKEKYEHSYPHCWRCDTPLINYATSSWFVSVTKIKEQLLESAKEINWSPNHLKDGRFGNWLEGARDWSISRQRFWASAIPIWECACGERHVVSSVAELEELGGVKVDDIHKDVVDNITFKCKSCGGEMKRVPDVLDCWFESGSMPYAQLHYPFENKEHLEENFPAQFVAEGIDQTRTWFYYLHVISGGLKGKHAFQNVIANGIVLAEDGKKMSKRLKNYPDPALVMDKYGADALRAYLLSSPIVVAESLNFSEKGVQESLRKNIMLLWNVYKFYETYAEAESNIDENLNSTNVLDAWILIKLNNLVKEVTGAMEVYNLNKAMRPITDFVDELSTWYLRRSRDRFKSDDLADKMAALSTTKKVLSELAKVMAPFMPFMAENLWQKVTTHNFTSADKSVHLESWPKFSEDNADDAMILHKMDLVRRVVEIGFAKRDELGIKVRQILASATVTGPETKFIDGGYYYELIKDELNIKDLIWKVAGDDLVVELDSNITPELKQEGLKRELVRFVNLARKDLNLSIGDRADLYLAQVSEEVQELINKLGDEVKADTLCDNINVVTEIPADLESREVKLGEGKILLGLKKN